MEFCILGPLEVVADGRRVVLGGSKPQALLALLLINANRTLSSDRLIEELWGDRPPANAAKTLQVHISRLRKALERGDQRERGDGIVVTRAQGYELRVDGEKVDSLRFERLLSEGRDSLVAGRVGPAASLLGQALSLWRGSALADFTYERFAESEITRLEELRASALEDLIEAKLALGRHAEVVGELESLISEHPYRERLRAQLMLALYRSDRQAEALQSYQAARRTLVEQLGIEPGERLRELEREILAQDQALAFIEPDPAVTQRALSRGAFVGRDSEFGELVASLDDAWGGRGRLVLLDGEPGIGKTRLVEALAGEAEARGARVLIGRCWEAGGAPAYWPWVQSLRSYIRDRELPALRAELGRGAVDLAQIVPEIRQRFPELAEPPVLDPEGARFRLFDSVAEFFRAAAERQPLVLVLDDLHAADAPSLLLMRFLARELGSIRALVVGAFRNVDPIPGGALTEMISAVSGEPVTRRLSLGGLSERDVGQYMHLSAAEIESSELAATVHAQTEGNPLFVGELVRLLALERRAESAGTPPLRIPDSVRGVIARRLAHLSSECRDLLEVASVLGRELSLHALARTARASEDEVLETLEEAIAARVLSDAPGPADRLRFAHVLIRDTLYEGLGGLRRTRLHREAVEALETLYGDQPGPHLAELAHHAIAARDFDKGMRYARKAADRSMALLAYEEAARLYRAALDAAEVRDPRDSETRCELMLSLGDARARAGDTPAAQSVFLDAAAVARQSELSSVLARAAVAYGGRLAWARAGDDRQMVPLLEEGLAALSDGEIELRARLLARLAGALRDEPSRTRRDTLSREAVELARRTGDASTLTYTLDGRAAAVVAHDTLPELLALGTELHEVAQRSGDLEKAVAGHVWRFHAQLMIGDIADAEREVSAASAIANELRQPVQLWLVTAAQALLALGRGRLHEARLLIEKAIVQGEHAQPHGALPIYWFQRLMLADFTEGLEEVEPALRNLAARYPARVMFRCAVGYLDARLGRVIEARKTVDDLATAGFSALPVDQEWLYGMSLLAETAALTDAVDAGIGLYELLAPWAGLNAADASEGIRGSISRYLGLLATSLGNHDQAALHYEQAIAANTNMGLKPWRAHTERDFARMLLTNNQPRDQERGLQLIADAIKTYRELGMESAAAQAIELARAR